jgi:transposase-like protein
MMKASQFSDEQIVHILQEAERGEQSIGAICRAQGITERSRARGRRATRVATRSYTPGQKTLRADGV